MYTSSLIPPQNLSIKPTHSPQEKVINNNTMTNFCVQNTPFEPNPAITDKIRVNKHVDNIVRTNHIMEAQNHPTLFRGGGRSERYFETPPLNKKFKNSLKANRPKPPQSTDTNMKCDPTPTIGIATTESSAPPTTETTPTHPRVQPPSPSAATHETTNDEPAAVDIPLPDGPPPLAALKLPQRLNIASRVRILETGEIEALPINEHTIKKNMIKKWERTRNKRIHKRITISKPIPLNSIQINPVPILTPATPLLPFQLINVPPFSVCGPGVSRSQTRG
ncbi:unnamed protein product [Meloidogyne enterolobii]|uniref:Uncharacterized protein n=1 Tax=Meloidogyne enterolobii TaxID=390850 RepID=A0ACB0Z6J5_MELEN